MTASPIEILQSAFGYGAFRPGQDEAIASVMQNRDVVAVMPTGGGKSLCYQVPAIALGGVTLVVSPLIALMKDQVDQLRRRGISAEALFSGQERNDQLHVMQRVTAGTVRLLYVAPERLTTSTFRQFIRRVDLRLVAIDEAHCVSEWGHDFRPSYLQIPRLFNDVRRVPMLAVTATATPDVREDIVTVLGLQNPVVVVRGFDRPNLALGTIPTAEKSEQIASWASRHPNESAIVYAGSRRRVEEFAYDLRQQGMLVGAYHAGMSSAIRNVVQDDFLSNRVRILVASSAFGMGIDKPDIRHVFHADLTLTLESYYQEAGRAGRDGAPAQCTMLYHPDDRALMEHFINSTFPERKDVLSVATYLQSFPARREGALLTLDVDSAGIAASVGLPKANVESALRVLEQEGILTRIPPSTSVTLTFTELPERLACWASRCQQDWRSVADVIVRLSSRSASTSQPIAVALSDLCRKADVPAVVVLQTLQAMQNARLLRFQGANATASMTILDSFDRLTESVLARREQRRRHAVDKLEAVQRYAESRSCKRSAILRYFGDPMAAEPCGRCSSCSPSTWSSASTRSTQRIERMRSAVRVVIQLESRFGRTVVADVLRGQTSSRLRSLNVSRCEDFGCLRNEPPHVAFAVIDAAIARGYLQSTGGQYPLLAITREGLEFVGTLPAPLPRPTKTHHSEYHGDLAEAVESAPLSVVRAIRPHHTLPQAAHDLGVRPAEIVSAVEYALRHGHAVSVGRLVPQELYRIIRSIVIARPHTTLRSILPELPPGTDVATARLAFLFVRAELFSSQIS
jgi:ATP-dependent DNA helicase RecQ